MRDILLLTRLELAAFGGINRYRHARDKKEKARFRRLAVAIALITVVLGGYIVGLVYGLVTLQLGQLVPAYLVMLTSLLLMILGIFRAGGALYSDKKLPLLGSLPLKPSAVVLSRFLALYLEDLLLAGTVMICGLVPYAVLCHPTWDFYPIAVAGALFIPALPTVIAALFGSLVAALAARTKHKSLWQSALTVVFVLAVIMFPTATIDTEFSLDTIIQLIATVTRLIEQIYPPAIWLGSALTGDHYDTLWLFIGVSVGALAGTVWLVNRYFTAIVTRLHSVSARPANGTGGRRQKLTWALTVREARRYFASSIYVTNTIIGPVLGCVLTGALCFTDKTVLTAAFPFPLDLPALIPLAFTAVCGMMPPASVSISMEGKQIWQLKSLPISAKALFDGKILFSLLLMTPSYILAQGFMVFALRPRAVDALFALLLPAVILVFVTVSGISINRRLHRFDWQKDEEIVKQSAPAMLGGFLCPLVCLALVGGCVALPAYSVALRGGASLLLLLATAILYRRNRQADLAKL